MSDTNTAHQATDEPGIADLLDAMGRATAAARAYHLVKAEADAELARVQAELNARVTIARDRYTNAVAEMQAMQAADQEAA